MKAYRSEKHNELAFYMNAGEAEALADCLDVLAMLVEDSPLLTTSPTSTKNRISNLLALREVFLKPIGASYVEAKSIKFEPIETEEVAGVSSDKIIYSGDTTFTLTKEEVAALYKKLSETKAVERDSDYKRKGRIKSLKEKLLDEPEDFGPITLIDHSGPFGEPYSYFSTEAIPTMELTVNKDRNKIRVQRSVSSDYPAGSAGSAGSGTYFIEFPPPRDMPVYKFLGQLKGLSTPEQQNSAREYVYTQIDYWERKIKTEDEYRPITWGEDKIRVTPITWGEDKIRVTPDTYKFTGLPSAYYSTSTNPLLYRGDSTS